MKGEGRSAKMAMMSIPGQKCPMLVFSGNSHPELAQMVAELVITDIMKTTIVTWHINISFRLQSFDLFRKFSGAKKCSRT